MQADNNKCGVGVAYNSKVGGKSLYMCLSMLHHTAWHFVVLVAVAAVCSLNDSVFWRFLFW